MENNSEIIIYESSDHQTQVEVKFENETVWLNQNQLAELFKESRANIVEHIQNIYKEGELDEVSTCRNFRQVQIEGKREVKRNIEHYNLDVIISVGYRVNSKQGTQFRQWATQRLKDYLVKGYAINLQISARYLLNFRNIYTNRKWHKAHFFYTQALLTQNM